MTYDELRDYIDKFDAAGMVNEPVVKALRAVVELHPPIYDNSCSDADCCGGPYPNLCDGCKDDYPCPTIQEIEKGLE